MADSFADSSGQDESSRDIKAKSSTPPVVEPSDNPVADIVEATVDTEPLTEGDAEAQLAALGAGVRDQDDLERDIGQQADQLLLDQANEREQRRLDRTQKQRDQYVTALTVAERNLSKPAGSATKNKYRTEIDHYKALIADQDTQLQQIKKRMNDRNADGQGGDSSVENGPTKRMPGESQREFLIRTGKITPFSKKGRQLLKQSSSLGDVLLDDQDEEEEAEDEDEEELHAEAESGPTSHQFLRAPGFEQDNSTAASSTVGNTTEDDAALAQRLQDEEFAFERPAKRRRLQNRRQTRVASEEPNTAADDSDTYVPKIDEEDIDAIGKSEGEITDDDDDDDVEMPTTAPHQRRGKRKQRVLRAADDEQGDLAGIDDGNEQVYQSRLESWIKRRRAARSRFRRTQNSVPADDGYTKSQDEDVFEMDEVESSVPEWQMSHPNLTDTEFEGGYRIPGDIYPSLFDYQKTGVQWLWELYSQQVGGIIGDEMGLGKTIQAISFLAGLHYSGKLTKPVVVVCPATVMKQWVNEFHRWWPPLRVSILHGSGSGMLNVKREASFEEDLLDDSYTRRQTQSKGHSHAKRIVDRVIRDGHVLVTTYTGLQTYAELLIPIDWEYAILDEGHQIRNPNTALTIYCKEIRTYNRIILSGTPMQNNLIELWSLFDFVYPMRLGTLVNFKNQFEIPIKHGGYANASNLQVETAARCAETLKDSISPYLLQRFKIDVAADLPKKTERVLFCKLTKLQRDAYEWFLESEEMKSIFAGKRHALYGIDLLRKICNHPDLVEHKTLSKKTSYAYGDGKKSGKMQVVKALLEIWKRGGHKTLLFAQHKIMLDILEIFIGAMPGFRYIRMDGGTSIKDRQNLVDQFNTDPELHVFLLTTKVGGLGVNLTGADRVIIYDPDWNPSTDVQARERAWRLGQKREVEIYRLMTAGTIEEKIYHRQIFKQFLTNKILRDPKQRQNFQMRDLHDLFTLGESIDGQTETGNIFRGTEVKLSSGKQNGNLPTPPEDSRTNKERLDDVAGISRQENFRTEEDEEQDSQTNGGKPQTKDDRMLSSIFARSGVQSAQDHDAIINGRRTIRADPAMIAKEAKRFAAEAAKELQRAGELARTLPAGTVTWTGQQGSAGRDPSPPRRGGMRGGMRGGARGGPSSSSILANLQHRQLGSAANMATNESPSSSRASTPATGLGRIDRTPKGIDFMKLIRDYLVRHNGFAYSQMLVDHFGSKCRTPEHTAQFQAMLKEIATKEKGNSRGRDRWMLKDEYR